MKRDLAREKIHPQMTQITEIIRSNRITTKDERAETRNENPKIRNRISAD